MTKNDQSRPHTSGSETATPQIDLNNLPETPVTLRSPMRFLLDDFLWWSSVRKREIIYFTTFDISQFTAIEKACRAQRQRPPSLVAYIASCLGAVGKEHPEFLASRLGKGLYVPQKVNVVVLVSALTPSGDPLPYTIEIPAVCSTSMQDISRLVADKSRALRREGIKSSPALDRAAWLGKRRRGTRFLLYGLCFLHPKFRRYLACFTSNIGLTCLTNYAGNRSGWGVPVLPFTVNVALGAMYRKALVVDEKVEIRDCLDVTFTLDHAISDGAPALQVISKLGDEIESGRLLAEFSAPEDGSIEDVPAGPNSGD